MTLFHTLVTEPPKRGHDVGQLPPSAAREHMVAHPAYREWLPSFPIHVIRYQMNHDFSLTARLLSDFLSFILVCAHETVCPLRPPVVRAVCGAGRAVFC